MERKLSISEELEGISRAVADISRGMPYAVPEGYFNALSDKVMGEIKRTPYQVDPAYFEEFASRLLARIKDAENSAPREELSVLSPLLSRLGKKTPFEVPEGYFNDLASAAIGKAGLRTGTDAAAPEAGDGSSPLLAGLRDKTTYQAPAGYFEGFPAAVARKLEEQAAQQAPAKVIPIGAERNGRSRTRAFRYLAAAAIAGILMTGGWMFYQRSTAPVAGNMAKNLANVSDQDIQNYLDTQNIPLAEVLNASTATLDINDNDVKDILGDVPDDELQSYLDDQGGKDPATN